MIHLSGLTECTPEQPDGDIPIEYVGLRPGEKLYEELLIGESVVPSGHPRIMCARERHIEPALLDKMLESLRTACEADDHATMLRLFGLDHLKLTHRFSGRDYRLTDVSGNIIHPWIA